MKNLNKEALSKLNNIIKDDNEKNYIKLIKNDKVVFELLNKVFLQFDDKKVDISELEKNNLNEELFTLLLTYLKLEEFDIVYEEYNDSIIEYQALNNYLGHILNTSPNIYTKEEEIEAFKKYKKGEIKKEEIAKHNYKLVFCIAKSISSNYEELEDFFQQGIIGLYSAIDRFDETYGYKFSTYATWWIRQAIIRYKGSSDFIRLPAYLNKIYSYVKKTMDEYEKKYGQEISISELSKITNIDINLLKRVMVAKMHPKSLDKQIEYNDEDGDDLYTVLKSPVEFEQNSINKVLFSQLDDIMYQKLSNIQIAILKLRHGVNINCPFVASKNSRKIYILYNENTSLESINEIIPKLGFKIKLDHVSNGTIIKKIINENNEKKEQIVKFVLLKEQNKIYTLEEVGEMFDLSRERIRQVEKNSLLKLRNSGSVKKMK